MFCESDFMDGLNGRMIEVNRAYEANQKTITSEDSMMSTLWQKVAVLN